MDSRKKPKIDKVCDICGDAGFHEGIVTCSQCKKASEHIYCMQNQLYGVPDIWYCKECWLVKVNVPNVYNELETEGSCLQVKKSKSLVEGMSPSCYHEDPGCINTGEKHIPGRNKPLYTQDGMQEMPDVGKRKRASTVFSYSSEPAMQLSSPSTNYKTPEIRKVKFLPTAEAIKLNFGTKLWNCTSKRSFHGSLHRNCQASAMPAPLSGLLHRTSEENIMTVPSNGLLAQSSQTNVTPSANGPLHQNCKATTMPSPNSNKQSLSIRISPKAVNFLSLPNGESVNAQICSPSKCILTVGHASKDKEEQKQKNGIIGGQVSIALCKKRSTEGSIDAEVHLSSKMPAGSKCDPSSMHDNDGPRKRSGALASLVKEEPGKAYIDHAVTTSVDSFLMHTSDKEWKIGFKKLRLPMKSDVPNEEVRNLHNGIAIVSPSGSQGRKSASKAMDLPLILLIDPKVNLPNCHAQKPCWNGTFEVFDVISQAYRGIQAHFPCQVSSKVYEIQKLMQGNLKLKVLHRTDAWPQVFRSDPPTTEDIGLYFFPSEEERSRERYFHLMERIDLRDSAMQSWVGEVELIIFTSKQLPSDCQRIGARFYFWGIFRHMRHKVRQHVQEQSPSLSSSFTSQRKTCTQVAVPLEGISEEVDMEIDMVGGCEIGRIDEPIKRVDAPPRFVRPISKDANHEKRPLVKFELEKVTCPISSSPPGFSQPPNFKHGRSPPISAHKSPTITRKDAKSHVSLSAEGGCATAVSEAVRYCHQVSHHEYKSPAEHSRSRNRSLSSEKKRMHDPFDKSCNEMRRNRPHIEAKVHTGKKSSSSLSAKKEAVACSSEKPVHDGLTISRKVTPPSTPLSEEKGDHYSVHPSFIKIRDPCQRDTRAQSMSSNVSVLTAREKCQNSPKKPLHESIFKVGEVVSFPGTSVDQERKVNGPEKSVPRGAERKDKIESQSRREEMLKRKTVPPEDVEGKNMIQSHREDNRIPEHVSQVSSSYDSQSDSPEYVTKDGAGGKEKQKKHSDMILKDKQLSLVAGVHDNPSSCPEQKLKPASLGYDRPSDCPESVTKDGARAKERQENHSNLGPQRKQLSLVSSSPEKQLIEAESTMLPLFPEESESIKEHIVELGIEGLDAELNISCPAAWISPDLSLSRPQYLKDGNIWISAKSKERLKKDGCGRDLQLSL